MPFRLFEIKVCVIFKWENCFKRQNRQHNARWFDCGCLNCKFFGWSNCCVVMAVTDTVSVRKWMRCEIHCELPKMKIYWSRKGFEASNVHRQKLMVKNCWWNGLSSDIWMECLTETHIHKQIAAYKHRVCAIEAHGPESCGASHVYAYIWFGGLAYGWWTNGASIPWMCVSDEKWRWEG